MTSGTGCCRWQFRNLAGSQSRSQHEYRLGNHERCRAEPVRARPDTKSEYLHTELHTDCQGHHPLDFRAGNPIQQCIARRLCESREAAANKRPAEQHLVENEVTEGEHCHDERWHDHGELQTQQQSPLIHPIAEQSAPEDEQQHGQLTGGLGQADPFR